MLEFMEQRSIEMTLTDICSILDDNRADNLRIEHAMRGLTHIHTFVCSLDGCIHHKKRNAYERLLNDIYFIFANLQVMYEDNVRLVDTPDKPIIKRIK